jgi:VWFA-related protein
MKGFTTKNTTCTKCYLVFPMIFVCLVLFVVKALSQAPSQPTFRAGVDLVEVDVSVLDSDRKPVRGLTAADFTVFEDGKARPVSAFTAVDVPPSIQPAAAATWTRDVISDVTTNALPDEGRLLVILMDRTIPDGYPTIAARDIARNAVREMGPNDVAAIVYSGGNGVPQNFTNDRARLVAAIDGSFAAAEASAEANANFDNLLTFLDNPSITESPNPGLAALNYSGECLCGSCVLETIGRIADAVKDVGRRRKSLLFIGRDLQVETVESICIDPVRKARENMFRALDISSLTVHALDPGGLETLSFAAAGRGGGYRGRANLVREGNISVLPDRTGGQVIKNNNNPAEKVADIVHESDSYYLLGFVPAAPRDGQRHDIRVRVNRRGVDVRTRRAYMAAPPPARVAAPPAPSATTAREGEAIARRSIEGLLPRRDNVTVTASITTLVVSETRAAVAAIALDVRHASTGAAPPALVPPAEQVDVVTHVFTLTGRSVGQFKQTLSIRPRRGAEGMSYELLQRLPVKPGQYEIRVGIYNEARRQTGSVYTFVDVPNYANAAFALSDVLVHSPGSAVAGAESVADVAAAPPTARRAFSRGENAVAVVRILQGKGAAAPVTMSARVVDTDNRRLFGQEITLPAADFARTGVTDYHVNLPLAGLESGQYLLTIDAKGSMGSAQRQLRFSVR